MSSFINSSQHFSTIKFNLARVMFFKRDPLRLPYNMEEDYGRLMNKTVFAEDKEKELFKIIDDFAALQALCVNLQYKHHSENLDEDIQVTTKEVKAYVEAKTVNEVQLLKLIKCSLYQVETEHVTELRELNPEEEKALNFMKKIDSLLLERIVCDSQNYMDSDWSL